MSDESHIQSGRDTIQAGGDVTQIDGDSVGRDKITYIIQPHLNHKAELLSWLDRCIENNIDTTDRYRLVECLLSCSACPSNSLSEYRSLESLVQFLFHNERDQDAKQQLLTTFDRIFCYEIPFEHLVTLTELVPQVELEVGTLRDVYRMSAPSGIRWKMPETPVVSILLEDIFYRLARANRQHDDTYPLLTFVNRLTALIPRNEPIRGALERWLRDSENILEIEQGGSVTAFDHQPQHNEITPTYLLIRLEPRDNNRYALTAWFGPEQQQIYPATIDDEVAQTLEQIEEVIQRLHDQVIKVLTGELIIELFLPVALLDLASDHWQMKQGKRSHFALGEKYQVITRSYDRIYDPELQNTLYDWRERWRQWKSILRGETQASVRWFHAEDDCDIDILMGNYAIQCLIFTFAPSIQFREELFWNLLDKGIPVALLPRKQTLLPEEMEQKLKALYSEGCKKLPMKLKSLRWQACDEMRKQQPHEDAREHYGYHLTLIWDDPERLPPDGILF